MKAEWKRQEDLESAKKIARDIIEILYGSDFVDDDCYQSLSEFANCKIADMIYSHDDEIRNACREVYITSAVNAMKEAQP
jgi:hypothetical protein